MIQFAISNTHYAQKNAWLLLNYEQINEIFAYWHCLLNFFVDEAHVV